MKILWQLQMTLSMMAKAEKLVHIIKIIMKILKMNHKKILLTISFILAGCPVASAYEIPEQKACVIDRCSDSLCYI